MSDSQLLKGLSYETTGFNVSSGVSINPFYSEND